MSREIKFRAWHKTRLAWIAGFNMFGFSNFHGGDKHLQRFGSEFPYESVDIEQFTGLTDKNGKEIYEGDILTHCPDCFPDEKPIYYNVIFKDGSFRQLFKMVKSVQPILCVDILNKCKDIVIGNIHENPELLA